MMFLEQFLEVALLLKIGHEHYFDFIQTRRSGVGERRSGRFLAFHAAKGKKLAEVCPAKCASTLFYRPPATFMHTRCTPGTTFPGTRGATKQEKT